MPLVVPGINSSMGGDKSSEWMSKLAGKKIGSSSDNMVSLLFHLITAAYPVLVKGDQRLITCVDIREERSA